MGASWKYLDNGSDQGTAWRESNFNDGSWITGNAEFGYGDGDETTIVSFGPNRDAIYVTTYFRKAINVTDANSFSGYTLNVRRDDGIVVYINGVEIYRNNMPAGTISYSTPASSSCSDDGYTTQTSTLLPGVLVTGLNVIAVEIHQQGGPGTDISFNLELIGLPKPPPVVVIPVSTDPVTIFPMGSSWKFLDNGSDQGTAWRESNFNDGSWTTANAEFGYGDGDEATLIKFGSNSNAKYITTYFRKSINLVDGSVFSGFTMNMKRDDGIVVYINGIERYRNNMPSGIINYTSPASSSCSDDGYTILTAKLPQGSFISGVNVIAVEIHQQNGTSTDISFNMELIGLPVQTTQTYTNVNLTRGPYLQIGTSNGISIRWRTDLPSDSKVSYGTIDGNLAFNVSSPVITTEHEVAITGLSANTKYFYSIGSSLQVLQGNATNYFITAPPTGSSKKTRVWVTGDCGNNSQNQLKVRDQFLAYSGSEYTDLWLLMGDNAYKKGLDSEYQTNFFDNYKDKLLKQTVLWPAPGNHEYADDGTRQNDHNVSYYSVFSMPVNGEAGGVASNTKSYYSFNYGNIHFISLDSYGKESNSYRLYDTLGPQVVWLKKDLAANTQQWTILFWHHPPYTMGSHNSDTETELVKIRQNLIRILDRFKVDLVLCGHSHCYERSKLMKGHYGGESTFSSSTHNLSNSTANYDGTAGSCPYVKSSASSYNGTVYVVAGSAGSLGGTQASWPHSAMHYSNSTDGGSLAIEIDQNRLDAKWICADGVFRDRFTLFKDVNKTTNITITKGQSATLNASWNGDYLWSTGNAGSKSITVSPSVATSYTVKDNFNCITDVFNVKVVQSLTSLTAAKDTTVLEMNVFPNPMEESTTVSYSIPATGLVDLSIYNASGFKLKTLVSEIKEQGSHTYIFNSRTLTIPAGNYLLKLSIGDQDIVNRISIH
jgi:hypothetical protein